MALKKSFSFNGIGRVEIDGIVFEKGSENFIKQAYEYLKTLPDFDGEYWDA
jgi:hypothetical protein